MAVPLVWCAGCCQAVFVAGSSFLAVDQIHSEHFIASPVRFAQAAAAIAALIVAAFAISRRPAPRVEASAPAHGW